MMIRVAKASEIARLIAEPHKGDRRETEEV